VYGSVADAFASMRERACGHALRRMASGDETANRVWLACALLALNLTAVCWDLCPADLSDLLCGFRGERPGSGRRAGEHITQATLRAQTAADPVKR